MTKYCALFFLIVLVLCISCQRITPVSENDFNTIEIPGIKGIPLEFGSLVAVTESTAGIANLWFQDDEKTIRIVRISVAQSRIFQKINVIPRH